VEYVESRLYRVEPALSHSSGCHCHRPPSPPSSLPPPSTAAGCRSPHLQSTPPAAAAVDCRRLQLSPQEETPRWTSAVGLHGLGGIVAKDESSSSSPSSPPFAKFAP
jgi:hypothetical protein